MQNIIRDDNIKNHNQLLIIIYILPCIVYIQISTQTHIYMSHLFLIYIICDDDDDYDFKTNLIITTQVFSFQSFLYYVINGIRRRLNKKKMKKKFLNNY